MNDSIQKSFLKSASLLFAAMFLMVSFTAVEAQDRQITDEQIEEFAKRAEETKARLGLTPEQEEAIQPILMNAREKQLGVLEKYGYGAGAKPNLSMRKKISMAKELKKVRGDTEKALAKHLTKEQMAEYKKIQDENREKMRARFR